MQAVAAVTHNRTLHKDYPSDICKVVFQPKQFSWTHQQKYDKIIAVMEGTADFNDKELKAYKQALDIAKKSTVEFDQWLPKGVVYYHANTVRPKWVDYKVKVRTIGSHAFYKDSKKG